MTAVRHDVAGFSEEARFFGEGVFGITYLPDEGPTRIGVVMCPPLLAQFNAHYRKETLLARHLAGRGIAVHRFHYRGTGNSDGETAGLTVERMVDDTGAASDLLAEVSGCGEAAFLGVSLGCLPAAVASRPSSPLVFDSPPVSGRAYFRKAFRSHTMAMMREGHREPPTAEVLLDRLMTSDDVSLLGFRLPRSFYEDVIDRALVDEVGEGPRPTLIVEGNRSGELTADSSRIRDDLSAATFKVDTVVTGKEDPFWYVDSSAPEAMPEVKESMESVGSWLLHLDGQGES